MKSMVLELVSLVGGAANHQRQTVPAIAHMGPGPSMGGRVTRVHKPALLAAAATNSGRAQASHGTKAVRPEEVIPLEDEF